jgi:hypothetical protein
MTAHSDHFIQSHAALNVYNIIVFIIVIIAVALSIWLYFIPTRIAYRRNHAMAGTIFMCNLLFGFTIAGWVVCLFWANSSDVKKSSP